MVWHAYTAPLSLLAPIFKQIQLFGHGCWELDPEELVVVQGTK